MSPLEVFKLKPVGSAGDTEYEIGVPPKLEGLFVAIAEL